MPSGSMELEESRVAEFAAKVPALPVEVVSTVAVPSPLTEANLAEHELLTATADYVEVNTVEMAAVLATMADCDPDIDVVH